VDPGANAGTIERPIDSPPGDDPPLPSFAALFKRLSPSVVNIYTQEEITQRLPRALAALTPQGTGTSLGSGMILDLDGHVLTNAHVVENAAEIRVRCFDESELPARLVGIDPTRDLALLKVDGAADLVPVVPGDSMRLEVGDWVLAIGNPLGLSHTLTKGIVSGMGRSELSVEGNGYVDLIQTDAPVNAGSSGGPLFDQQGRVVGVTSAMSSVGQGIAFAIPWHVVTGALPRLRQGGEVSRSWLGVYVRPLGDQKGVLVEAVVDESPADRAGLQPGDAILRVGDRPVEDVAEFRLRVAAGVAGKPVVLLVRRGETSLELRATLEEARELR
jgi:S1-C subfamily serine protease